MFRTRHVDRNIPLIGLFEASRIFNPRASKGHLNSLTWIRLELEYGHNLGYVCTSIKSHWWIWVVKMTEKKHLDAYCTCGKPKTISLYIRRWHPFYRIVWFLLVMMEVMALVNWQSVQIEYCDILRCELRFYCRQTRSVCGNHTRGTKGITRQDHQVLFCR